MALSLNSSIDGFLLRVLDSLLNSGDLHLNVKFLLSLLEYNVSDATSGDQKGKNREDSHKDNNSGFAVFLNLLRDANNLGLALSIDEHGLSSDHLLWVELNLDSLVLEVDFGLCYDLDRNELIGGVGVALRVGWGFNGHWSVACALNLDLGLGLICEHWGTKVNGSGGEHFILSLLNGS